MKPLLFVLGLIATSAFAASAPQSDRVLGDLSRCDSTFFSTLGQHATEYAPNPYFRTQGALGYFQVANRGDMKLSVRRFPAPMSFGALDAVAYFDEVLTMGEHQVFVSWGFVLRAPIRDVVSSTQSLIWEGQRLRQDDPIFVRSEVWTHGKTDAGWERAATVEGQVPKPGTVERLLMIEPYEDDASLTRFGCSLQGSVTREMLRSERPDLGIK